MTDPIPFTPTYGLTVTVHRTQRSGTNGGISSRHTELTVVGVIDDVASALASQPSGPVPLTDGEPISELNPDAAVYLRVRRAGLALGPGPLYSLEPVGQPRPWCMFGGNEATSTDPRFIALAGGNAHVPIDDRIE